MTGFMDIPEDKDCITSCPEKLDKFTTMSPPLALSVLLWGCDASVVKTAESRDDSISTLRSSSEEEDEEEG